MITETVGLPVYIKGHGRTASVKLYIRRLRFCMLKLNLTPASDIYYEIMKAKSEHLFWLGIATQGLCNTQPFVSWMTPTLKTQSSQTDEQAA